MNSQYAELKGRIHSSSSSGHPSGYTHRNRGFNVVNFAVLDNDGCGAGLWTCHANHTCSKRVVAGFTVTSGSCGLSDDGNCVSSVNFPSKYADNERCTIKSPSEGTLTFREFNTEHGYDKMTVGGSTFQGSSKPADFEATGADLSWRSDGSVTRKGWQLCVSGAPATTATPGGAACTVTANAAISGHNREHLTSQTVSTCSSACRGRTWCKSFDYKRSSGSCDLSDKSSADVALKTNYPGHPYDHYDCTQALTLQQLDEQEFTKEEQVMANTKQDKLRKEMAAELEEARQTEAAELAESEKASQA